MAKVRLTLNDLKEKCPNLFAYLDDMGFNAEEMLEELDALVEDQIKKALKHSRALQTAKGGR